MALILQAQYFGHLCIGRLVCPQYNSCNRFLMNKIYRIQISVSFRTHISRFDCLKVAINFLLSNFLQGFYLR